MIVRRSATAQVATRQGARRRPRHVASCCGPGATAAARSGQRYHQRRATATARAVDGASERMRARGVRPAGPVLGAVLGGSGAAPGAERPVELRACARDGCGDAARGVSPRGVLPPRRRARRAGEPGAGGLASCKGDVPCAGRAGPSGARREGGPAAARLRRGEQLLPVCAGAVWPARSVEHLVVGGGRPGGGRGRNGGGVGGARGGGRRREARRERRARRRWRAR